MRLSKATSPINFLAIAITGVTATFGAYPSCVTAIAVLVGTWLIAKDLRGRYPHCAFFIGLLKMEARGCR
mgnify:CR=1 FL=1